MKTMRDDNGWLKIPTITYINSKNPRDIIEVFQEEGHASTKIVQTTKEGCQSLVVNNSQLVKMLQAFKSSGWMTEEEHEVHLAKRKKK